jgi:hypothetical protein
MSQLSLRFRSSEYQGKPQDWASVDGRLSLRGLRDQKTDASRPLLPCLYFHIDVATNEQNQVDRD